MTKLPRLGAIASCSFSDNDFYRCIRNIAELLEIDIDPLLFRASLNLSKHFYVAVGESNRFDGADSRKLQRDLNNVFLAATLIKRLIHRRTGFSDFSGEESLAHIMILEALSLNMEVGSKASEQTWQLAIAENMDQIAHAANLAHASLDNWQIKNVNETELIIKQSTVGEDERDINRGGAPSKDHWKLHFVRGCIAICNHLEVKPTISKTEKKSESPYGGGLFVVAKIMITLFPEELRYKSDVTLFKDLQRLRPIVNNSR